MKKKIIILFFVISVAFPLFAAKSWFTTYNAAYNVNLSDPNDDYVGTDSGEWNTPGYSDHTLVAQFGFSETDSPVTISVSFNNTGNPNWMYQSASQPNLHRPFGLDVIVRQRWYRWNCTNSNNGTTDETVDVLHFGIQPGGDTSLSASIPYNNVTNGSIEKDGNDLPGSHTSVVCGWYSHQLIGAWVEFVLVLPDIDPDDSSYIVGSADDYYASFDIQIEGGGVNGSYHCEFTGWYEQEKTSESDNFVLNVVPNAAASSINLDEINNIQYGGDGIKIGDYSYSTTRDSSIAGHEYFAFVSSSPEPDISMGNFELVLETETLNTNGGNSSVAYEIGIESDSNHDPKIMWFDGDCNMYMAADSNDVDSTFYSSQYREGQQIQDDGTLYQYYDDGNIRFRLANGSDTTNLLQGIYKSNVYFHVVAWK